MSLPPGFDYDGYIGWFQHLSLPFVGITCAISAGIIAFKTLKRMKIIG